MIALHLKLVFELATVWCPVIVMGWVPNVSVVNVLKTNVSVEMSFTVKWRYIDGKNGLKVWG